VSYHSTPKIEPDASKLLFLLGWRRVVGCDGFFRKFLCKFPGETERKRFSQIIDAIDDSTPSYGFHGMRGVGLQVRRRVPVEIQIFPINHPRRHFSAPGITTAMPKSQPAPPRAFLGRSQAPPLESLRCRRKS